MSSYDVIGRTYSATRQADPRIAAAIEAALGDAASVVNVGAGTGSYEPATTLLAVEPSTVMIAQRPGTAAPAVQAVAERLPLIGRCADASLAVLTIHHWNSVSAGIAEMRRISRRRLVILTWDPEGFESFWLTSDYLSAVGRRDRRDAGSFAELRRLLPNAVIRPVSVPHDCVDGFAAAYWRRPEAYLDPAVRAGISLFARYPESDDIATGLDRLAADLDSGAWQRRNRHLLDLEEIDLGYRLVIAEV